jgi:hypothetical protein
MILPVGARVRQYERPYQRRYWDGFIRGNGATRGTVRIVWNDGIVDDVPLSDFESGFIRIIEYERVGYEVREHEQDRQR